MELKGRLMSAEVLMVGRCRQWECRVMMVAMGGKDSGVICVVEHEVDALYAIRLIQLTTALYELPF